MEEQYVLLLPFLLFLLFLLLLSPLALLAFRPGSLVFRRRVLYRRGIGHMCAGFHWGHSFQTTSVSRTH
jgi:hypothetical protein